MNGIFVPIYLRMKYFHLTILLVAVLCQSTFPQQPTYPGIELYKIGKYREAIASLNSAIKDKQYEKNAEIWHYLGLSSVAEGDYKTARKSFEKAVKIEPENSMYRGNLAYGYLLEHNLKKAMSEAEKVIKIDPKNHPALIVRGTAYYWEKKYDAAERDIDQALTLEDRSPQSYIIKSKILVSRMSQRLLNGSSMRKELVLLRQATETLKTGLEKCSPKPRCTGIDEEYETLSIFLDYFSKNNSDDIRSPTSAPPASDPGTTPMKIISKRLPSYTDAARGAGVRGTITVVAMFGANGKIEHALFLSRLGSGLDEEVLKAVRKIKFEPATKDGKPISVVKRIEYGFDIY